MVLLKVSSSLWLFVLFKISLRYFKTSAMIAFFLKYIYISFFFKGCMPKPFCEIESRKCEDGRSTYSRNCSVKCCTEELCNAGGPIWMLSILLRFLLMTKSKSQRKFFLYYYFVYCRLYFINRHFADLAELRDFTRLIIVIVKIPIKSNETI